MKESVMKHKKVLGLLDEPNLLMCLEEEILESCPECSFDKATNYDVGVSTWLRTHTIWLFWISRWSEPSTSWIRLRCEIFRP